MSETVKEQTSERMLTTIDNPFNPFKQFDQWNQFDQAKGYNTLAYLGRIVDYDNCVTEEDRREARELAIEQILIFDPLQIYCKVSKDEEVKPIEIVLKQKEKN
jgi:hypothetical protein